MTKSSRLSMSITLSIVLLVACALLLCACGEPANPADKEYNITATSTADYTVTAPSTAKAGDTVKITVTLNNAEIVVDDVQYNGTSCTATSSGYSFTMPDSDVTITVVTSQLQEILTTNFISFGEENQKIIAVAGSGTFDWDTRDFILYVDTNYTTGLRRAEITSTNQSVIPDTAIDYDIITNADLIGHTGSNVIEQISVEISPFDINIGSTYLIMDFASTNISSEVGKLIVKIDVVEYGKVIIPTMTETVTFDLSDLSNIAETYNVRVANSGHIDGSNLPSYQDFVCTVVDGKISVTFEYAIGCDYWLRVTEGDVDDADSPLVINDYIMGSGSSESGFNGYSEGDLTFITSDTNLTLTVTD